LYVFRRVLVRFDFVGTRPDVRRNDVYEIFEGNVGCKTRWFIIVSSVRGTPPLLRTFVGYVNLPLQWIQDPFGGRTERKLIDPMGKVGGTGSEKRTGEMEMAAGYN